MDNLKEMNKFLEMLNLIKLNQEEIEDINRQIISNEINNFKIPKTKVQEQWLQLHSTKHLNKH